MIVCPRCSKENQDHYKFCLGCGAELPRDAAQPKSFTAPTPPAGMPAVSASSVEGGAAEAPAAPAPPPPSAPSAPPAPAAPPAAVSDGTVTCPQCGTSVPANFKFCGSCGHDMKAAGAAPAAAAPAAPPPAADMGTHATVPATEGVRGTLVLIRPDGSEGESFPLGPVTTVGRETSGPFASDAYLSPRHASFEFGPDGLVVKDLDSLNGVFVRIAADAPVELVDGSTFRIGQEILRFERMGEPEPGPDGTQRMGSPNPGFIGRIRLVIGRDTYGNSYCVPPQGLHLGRERGDIIFPEDGYVSGLHCRIHQEGDKVFLTDVGSSNGTFLRVQGQAPVKTGSTLLMGMQLFRVEY